MAEKQPLHTAPFGPLPRWEAEAGARAARVHFVGEVAGLR